MRRALPPCNWGRIFACAAWLATDDSRRRSSPWPRRGYVVWEASRVGGALKLRRSDPDWEIETVSDWIT